MNLEKLTKRELIELCQELQKVAEYNKEVADRATSALAECTVLVHEDDEMKSTSMH
jgi:hypothetical protein